MICSTSFSNKLLRLLSLLCLGRSGRLRRAARPGAPADGAAGFARLAAGRLRGRDSLDRNHGGRKRLVTLRIYPVGRGTGNPGPAGRRADLALAAALPRRVPDRDQSQQCRGQKQHPGAQFPRCAECGRNLPDCGSAGGKYQRCPGTPGRDRRRLRRSVAHAGHESVGGRPPGTVHGEAPDALYRRAGYGNGAGLARRRRRGCGADHLAGVLRGNPQCRKSL